MTHINFPIPLLKMIEPALKECINYDSSLFLDEYSVILNAYYEQDDQTELSEAYKEYVNIPPLSETKVPVNIPSDTAYEFALKIGKKLSLPWNRNDLNEFNALCNKYAITENPIVMGGLLILVAIYEKYKVQPDFGLTQLLDDTIGLNYTYSTRPDLLKLYCYMHNNKNHSAKVTIQYENESKLELNNSDNWFFYMAQIYLNKQLGVADVKAALDELEKDYNTAPKKGRKKEKPELDILLMCCYNLLSHHSELRPKGVLLTDQAALFISDFLTYVGVLDDRDNMQNSEVAVRAKVKYLLNTEFTPIWYKIPNLKTSPEDDESMEDFRGLDGYIGTIEWEKHPILSKREALEMYNKVHTKK